MCKLLFCGGVRRNGPCVVTDIDERSATVRHGPAAPQGNRNGDNSAGRRECYQWLSY
jgi:hypothetical protein